MPIGKKFTPPTEKVKLKIDIRSDVLEELKLYVKCGQEEYDWLNADIVIEQLLEDSLKKDRAFRSWLKQHNRAEKHQQAQINQDHTDTENQHSQMQ